MLTWKDASGYERGDKVRTPTVFNLELTPRFTISVHRWMSNQDPTSWYLTCHAVNIDRLYLGSEDVEEAKREAINTVKQKVESYAASLAKVPIFPDTQS